MSFITFTHHMLLDEVAGRPKSRHLFLQLKSVYTFSLVTKTELILFFNVLVLLLDNFNNLVLKQSDMIDFSLTYTNYCVKILYTPGYYFKHYSYYNLLSSYSYLAPLKGFFD